MSSRCVTLALYGVAFASSVGGCSELRSAPSPPLSERAPDERPPDAEAPGQIELTQGVARLQPVDGEQARGTVELTQTSDGVVVDAEPRARCLGDLGTVQPNADGVARLEAMVPALTLERGAANSLPGHVVIVHEWVDDWAREPEAEPGRAVACGVIRLVRPMS